MKKGEIDSFQWTDKDGKKLVAQDSPDKLDRAGAGSRALPPSSTWTDSIEVTAGGVGYGKLSASMTSIKAQNRLWQQFVKQLQIVAVTLFLMLQFIWLIFRGNLGTLRMLAEGANRFSQGDHAVRIEPEGAPEVGSAAEAFNNMANNIESLIASLGKSESKNKLLATIVEQSSEAIWTKDLGRHHHQLELRRRRDVRLRPDRGDRARAERGRVDAGRGAGAHAAADGRARSSPTTPAP